MSTKKRLSSVVSKLVSKNKSVSSIQSTIVKDTICAQTNPKSNTFSILVNGTSVYDPGNTDHKRTLNRFKLRKVSKSAYSAYLKYLATKQKRHLTISERELVNNAQ